MAFKKSGNSRDDRSANSSRRTPSQGGDRPARSGPASRSKTSSSGFKKSDPDNDRPKKRFDSEPGGERKSFKKPGEGYKGKPSGDFKSKPYGSKDFSDKSSFREGGYKKPYGTKDFGDSKSSSEGRFKKEGGSDFKKKPYGTRDFNDKPASREGGFKKEGSGYKGKQDDNRPFRLRKDGTAPKSRPADKPRSVRETFFDPEQPQPDRTMRGRKKSSTQDPDKGKIRLNRYISNAGICSRRKADELIVAGVVSVNGVVISELGFKVDPINDEVRYNGETLKREKMVYVLLNKPKDYITTTDDPQERRTVMHLVEKASKERIYPVGRLDRNTTGLLLMTNDGDLADKLSHPRSNITKLYQVELDKSLTQGDMNKIAYGLELEDGLIKPDNISYVQGGSKREIGIQIHSGKNRIVRRIFESLGYNVVKLDRSIYAGLTKKDLPRGRWRYLEEQEIIQLKHLI